MYNPLLCHHGHHGHFVHEPIWAITELAGETMTNHTVAHFIYLITELLLSLSHLLMSINLCGIQVP